MAEGQATPDVDDLQVDGFTHPTQPSEGRILAAPDLDSVQCLANQAAERSGLRWQRKSPASSVLSSSHDRFACFAAQRPVFHIVDGEVGIRDLDSRGADRCIRDMVARGQSRRSG